MHLLIDGSPVPDPAQDEVLTFDDKPHALVFSCVNDICEPRTIAIAAGDKDDTISVALRVPPAKVVIDGEPGHSYRIEEMPGIALSPGAVSEVPIVSGGTRMITVFDVLDPSKKKTVQIEAGKQKTVSLKGP